MAELKISEVKLKKILDNLSEVKEQINIKDRHLNIAKENNDKLTMKNKETHDEIKELKNKLKGNISLIESMHFFGDDINQAVRSKWVYIHINAQWKIMMTWYQSIIDA